MKSFLKYGIVILISIFATVTYIKFDIEMLNSCDFDVYWGGKDGR